MIFYLDFKKLKAKYANRAAKSGELAFYVNDLANSAASFKENISYVKEISNVTVIKIDGNYYFLTKTFGEDLTDCKLRAITRFCKALVSFYSGRPSDKIFALSNDVNALTISMELAKTKLVERV